MKIYEQLPNRDALFLWMFKGNTWPDLLLGKYSLKTKIYEHVCVIGIGHEFQAN